MAAAMAGWLSILQLLAIVYIIVVAFGLMFGMVKPSDALKHVCVFLGLVIVLMILPGILIGAWSRLLLWQKLGLTVVAIALWFRWRPKEGNKNGRSK